MSRLMRGSGHPTRIAVGALCFLCSGLGGCFAERVFPMRPGDVYRVAAADTQPRRLAARAWLRRTHHELAYLLPPAERPVLLTEELTGADGQPIRIYTQLFKDRERVHTVLGNYEGMLHSAQATGSDCYVDDAAPLWPGCRRVWVPVGAGLELSAQLGLAQRDGVPLDADCIVIIPGFFGDSSPFRSRDLGQAFLAEGLHVLALEQRGTGQTEARYPEVPNTFGLFETGDLLAVSEWLQRQPHVRRTGLVGCCWGANGVLLAAWEDGRPADDAESARRLRAVQRPARALRHYEAGVIAFSPTLRFEEFADRTAQRWSVWSNAVLQRFQLEVERRQRRKGYAVTGYLRDLVDSELQRSAQWYPEIVSDGYDYLRLLPYNGRPAGDKLEAVRVPTLIVHAINDPMANAQDVPDLIATVENPNVAALMLPGGGHLGFAAYARRYYYSLLINFFDPQRGPTGLSRASASGWEVAPGMADAGGRR